MNICIEESRIKSVSKAIEKSLKTTNLEEISLLTGGGSGAQILKFKAHGHYYVLRLMGLNEALEDRTIQVVCAQYGGKLKIAPRCHYANAEEGIIITDYIQHLPVNKDIILAQMPLMLNKLHYSEEIPDPFYVVFPYMHDFIEELIQVTPSQELMNYCKAIQNIMLILAKHRQLASCHNDLNSENILFDGQQIYLIDFEAAGREDPYFDLATTCQQHCFSNEEEIEFLHRYLGRAANTYELSKFYLMKQVSYCYHVIHFFQHAYNAGMMILDENTQVPTFKEWYEGRKQGQYALNTPTDLILYATSVLRQSLADMNTLTFKQAKQFLQKNFK